MFPRLRRFTVRKSLIEKFHTVFDKNSFTGISCLILGYAKCKWTDEQNNKVVNHARENYIKQSFCLLGDADTGQVGLTAGQHKLNISYMLSSYLPTSFRCKNGSIKYKILVTVERTWKMDLVFDFPFTVIRPLNLNNE